MRRAGTLVAGGMLGWCVLEVCLRAVTGTLGGAGSVLAAGAAAAVTTAVLVRRAG